MANQEVQVAEFLLNDFYGPIVSAVGHQLLRHFSLTLPQLRQKLPTEYPMAKIKESLMCLLQNGLASSIVDRDNELKTQFRLPIDNAVSLMHCAGFIYRANLLFGEVGREIAHEFTLHGQLTCEEVVNIVAERLERSEEDVRKSLIEMFQTQFVRTSSMFEEYLLAKEETGDSKKVEPLIQEYNTNLTPGIMYALNRQRFYRQERNELVIELVGALHSHHYAKNIVRCMIRLHETKARTDLMGISMPMRQDEIVNMVEKEFKIPRNETIACLRTLVFVARNTQYRPEDDILVIKRDDFHTDSYVINWLLATRLWLRQTALRYATERHGGYASCILGMLLSHGASEIDAVQRATLICPKEAKSVMYTLETDGFVERLENIVAGDGFYRQDPRYRSSYLHLARLLEQRWQQAISNLLVQRKKTADQHRVLLNKYKTLDKFARTLEEPQDICDLWASLTRPERHTLSVLRQQMLQTGVQQQTLCRELIMIKYATKMFLNE
ncbi:uncharacterized protein LOC111261721 [Varroa jacobsoni]|uniref:DNA-directed RNA polymerase III subunit RPC3 n=1 Tax=Varroa destructor TaxID=109461 RepID=A0A7M7JRW8_VARDE|nr:uncharacterized protein LOC111245770 [Varroa destructor]XP_022691154.1 uncharacterized protein LOC111261721 [Varroa jacobsoni]